MCFDPITAIAGIQAAVSSVSAAMGTIGTVATIGGGVLSAYSQVQNANAQADTATRTANLQSEAALQALEQGNQESDIRRQQGAAARATNTAAMAANGVDVTGAQAIDVLDDSQTLLEQDAFAIRENSRRTAGNFSQASANSIASANSARSQAAFAPIKTLLGTAASVGNKYKSWVPSARGEFGGAA